MFFYLSKLLGFFLDPTNLLAFSVVFGFFFVWRGRLRLAKWLLGFATLILALVMFTPLPELLLWPLEQRFARLDPLPEKVDGIVLLGGAQRPVMTALHQQASLNSAAETLTNFVGLARHYPNAKLVFTGGTGDPLNQHLSEADTVRLFFREQGLDPARVIYEERSRNTYENALLTEPLAQPQAGERWLMLAAAASTPRAVGAFRKVGWQVTAFPSDYNSNHWTRFRLSTNLRDRLYNVSLAAHEWMGLAIYYWTGKSSEFFPQP